MGLTGESKACMAVVRTAEFARNLERTGPKWKGQMEPVSVGLYLLSLSEELFAPTLGAEEPDVFFSECK